MNFRLRDGIYVVVAAAVMAGAAGLPIFAGSQGGWQRLTGPTGGYLLGFLPATFLPGAALKSLLGALLMMVWRRRPLS